MQLDDEWIVIQRKLYWSRKYKDMQKESKIMKDKINIEIDAEIISQQVITSMIKDYATKLSERFFVQVSNKIVSDYEEELDRDVILFILGDEPCAISIDKHKEKTKMYFYSQEETFDITIEEYHMIGFIADNFDISVQIIKELGLSTYEEAYEVE